MNDKSNRARGALKVLRTVFYMLILGAVTGACGFFYAKYTKLMKVRTESVHQAVSRQILKVAELTAIKSKYSDIVCIKKSSAFAKAYAIVKYSAVMRIGIEDASAITFEITGMTDGSQQLTVRVPHCEILENSLLKQEVFDEKTSIFVPISTQEIFEEIELSMADFALDAERSGLAAQAEDHLEELVKMTFGSLGFESISVEFLD